jgi:hypothetical protein
MDANKGGYNCQEELAKILKALEGGSDSFFNVGF